MGRKRVGLLISLIVISLAGLIFFQGVLLRDAIHSREQTFNNNVAIALNSAIELIEKHKTVEIFFDIASDVNKLDSMQITMEIEKTDAQDTVRSNLFIFRSDTAITLESNMDSIAFKRLMKTQRLDSLFLSDTGDIKDISIFKTVKDQPHLQTDSTAYIYSSVLGALSNDRVSFVQKILNQMWVSEINPVENRLDSALIDSSLTRCLADVNIDLDFVFGVSIGEPDSLIVSPKIHIDDLLNSNYRTSLFPLDIISGTPELLLFFPDRQVYLWKQILPMLLIVGAFIMIIIATFIYTIKVILIQKRNEMLMADFVNNMTHEFKTPISTIALATEAILRKDMISDNEKVTQFSIMIQDENKRMQNQAEKILHMASMENGEFKLKLESIDVRKVIEESMENISLSIQKNNGSVYFENKAVNFIIQADRMHLSGIINNLLDNAVKYSPENPDISISALNADNGIYIRVADKGIGISKSNLKMIFNKYFRVSSGNIHDVKGFGLGLSYVKLMIEAHGGSINIKSQLEKGTRVELFFPQ